MTIKEYSESRHITYEAARKCLRRYEDELKGHLIKNGKSLQLDDEAVKYLDEKRTGNAPSNSDRKTSKTEKKVSTAELSKLNAENSALKIRLELLQTKLEAMEKECRSFPNNAEKSDADLLIENKVLTDKICELKETLQREKDKNTELEAERIEMMNNDWTYTGSGNFIQDGGCLVRHHYNNFERYENPAVDTIFDIFFMRKNSDDLASASIIRMNTKKLDKNSSSNAETFSPRKKLVLSGKSEILMAEEIVNKYGPYECSGKTRDGKASTPENIIIPMDEVKDWMIEIGAEDFLKEEKKTDISFA